jgi:hypothetical protein
MPSVKDSFTVVIFTGEEFSAVLLTPGKHTKTAKASLTGVNSAAAMYASLVSDSEAQK